MNNTKLLNRLKNRIHHNFASANESGYYSHLILCDSESECEDLITSLNRFNVVCYTNTPRLGVLINDRDYHKTIESLQNKSKNIIGILTLVATIISIIISIFLRFF